MPNPLSPVASAIVDADVARALAEDIGSGDVSALLIASARASAALLAREPGVLAGRAWFERCFTRLDPDARFAWTLTDGERFAREQTLCTIEADARALLSAERSALNFLQTLSATATATRAFVDALAGTRTRVLDTRKTLPGLRQAQKYAVRVGGGCNHRMGLYDAVMLKENHLLSTGGSFATAIAAARTHAPGLPVIVEVEDIGQLRAALAACPDRIVLDDFALDQIRDAVRIVSGQLPLEVSGGVNRQNVRAIAETGVDFVSIGAITKHVHAIDLSLRVQACR